MKFRLTVEMDNAAFHDDDRDDDNKASTATGAELARILRRLASDVEDCTRADLVECYGDDPFPVRDVNGNRAGVAKVVRR